MRIKKTAAPVAPVVAEASQKLADEVTKNEAAAPRFPGSFPSAQPKSEWPTISEPMRRIVETTFLVDEEIERVAERLRSALVIGSARSDYGTVMKHLDEAEENSRLANQLLVTAKIERDAFEAGAEVVMAGMRTAALEKLEADKASGHRTKLITDADVVSKMAGLFADEWESHTLDRRRLELTVRHLEHNVEVWNSRCRSLQTIASKLR